MKSPAASRNCLYPRCRNRPSSTASPTPDGCRRQSRGRARRLPAEPQHRAAPRPPTPTPTPTATPTPTPPDARDPDADRQPLRRRRLNRHRDADRHPDADADPDADPNTVTPTPPRRRRPQHATPTAPTAPRAPPDRGTGADVVEPTGAPAPAPELTPAPATSAATGGTSEPTATATQRRPLPSSSPGTVAGINPYPRVSVSNDCRDQFRKMLRTRFHYRLREEPAHDLSAHHSADPDRRH